MTGKIPILLLAAGSSSRMGQSKQLLNIDSKPLIRKTVDTLLASGLGPVIVVLGSNERDHALALQGAPVEIVSNTSWQNGMGSSIKSGLHFVRTQHPDAAGVLITVCDQPHLTSEHLRLLASALRDGFLISASYYGAGPGVPALFHKDVFKALMEIDDGDGAKKVILTKKQHVTNVPFPEGEIDLDTMEDYNTFIS